MPRYAALMRGINVGGKAKLAMADLRAALEGAGYENVQTYIQSGNVAFDTKRTAPATLAKAIEKLIASACGVDCTVVVRTAGEMAKVAAAHPFPKSAPPKFVYVMFCDKAPRKKLEVPAGSTEQFVVAGNDIYGYYPDGYGTTKVGNTYLERQLGVRVTARNWNTVQKLAGLVSPK
jgi:uncharacterized protein (DUF1697 family)